MFNWINWCKNEAIRISRISIKNSLYLEFQKRLFVSLERQKVSFSRTRLNQQVRWREKTKSFDSSQSTMQWMTEHFHVNDALNAKSIREKYAVAELSRYAPFQDPGSDKYFDIITQVSRVKTIYDTSFFPAIIHGSWGFEPLRIPQIRKLYCPGLKCPF